MECKNNADIHGEDCEKLRIKEEPHHPEEITTESQTSHAQQNGTHFMSSEVGNKTGNLKEAWNLNIASCDIKSNPKQTYTYLGTGTINCVDETDIKGECVYQDEVSPESQKLNLQQIETHFVDTKVGIKQEVWLPNGVSSNIKCDPLLGTGSTNHDEVDIKEELWWCEETSADSLNEREESRTRKNDAAEDVPLLLSSRLCTDTGYSSSAAQLQENKTTGHLYASTSTSTEKCKTKHTCKTCGKMFKLWSHLLKHNLVPKGCRWKNCDKNCTSSDVYKDGMIHNHRRQYDTCGKTFAKSKNFKVNLLIHDTRQYKCKICDKSYRWSGDLKRHLLVHDDKKRYKCQMCEKSFKQLRVLKSHLLVHNDKRQFNCEICEKSFKRSGHLKTHLMVHEDTKQYKCKMCEKNFKRPGDLKSHLMVHKDTKQYKCQICEKGFKRPGDLKSHLIVHEDAKQYKCKICDKSFKRSSHLKSHLIVHEDTKQFKCQTCDKSFKQSGHLKSHLMVHDDTKQYKCQICKKSFKRSGDLKTHLMVHEDIKQYKCHMCDKSFKNLCVLKSHLLVHNDKRQFKCEVCAKSFKRSGDLKTHLLVHSDERQFKCEICAKSFKRLSYLKKHLLIHSQRSNTSANFVPIN